MKQQSLFKALSILFALLLSLPASAQGLIVHKKDGTKVKYSYEELDRIETYNYDEEIPEDTGTGEITVNGVTFTMISVEGGTFTMGATSEQGSDTDSDESPTHQVTVSDFYIGKYEVTQGLWEAVMSYSGTCADGSSMSAYASDVWLDTNPSSS